MKSLKLMLAVVLALGLMATGATAQESEKCTGAVKAVDCTAKKITVTAAGKDMTCTVADDAKITLNGKPAKLADLKAGDSVECEHVKMTAKVIAATRK